MFYVIAQFSQIDASQLHWAIFYPGEHSFPNMASIVTMELTSTLLIIVRLIKKPALLLSLEGALNLVQIFTNGHRLGSATQFPDLVVEELCLEIHFWWLISYCPKRLVAVNILHMSDKGQTSH